MGQCLKLFSGSKLRRVQVGMVAYGFVLNICQGLAIVDGFGVCSNGNHE